jgi:hypothetical protein
MGWREQPFAMSRGVEPMEEGAKRPVDQWCRCCSKNSSKTDSQSPKCLGDHPEGFRLVRVGGMAQLDRSYKAVGLNQAEGEESQGDLLLYSAVL